MQSVRKKIWYELYEELYKFIYFKVRNQADARELVRDIFIKIHLTIDVMIEDARLSTRIYYITRDSLTDYFRREMPCGRMLPTGGKTLYQVMHHNLQTAIDKMEDPDRENILMEYMQQLTPEQFSNFLGISYGEAADKIVHAHGRLKSQLRTRPFEMRGCC
jgi:RNA polymerase sigma-70 factor, ECF subfamily